MKKLIFLFVFFQCFNGSVFSQNMEWICHPGKYKVIEYLGNDLFKVKNPMGKWGIMTAEGRNLLEAQYDSITTFMEGRSLIMDYSGKKIEAILDENGRILKSLKDQNLFTTNYPFYKEGRLGVRTENGLCGYLNLQGEISIKPRFFLAAPFQNGIATVQYADGDGYFGLINKSGGSAIVSDTKYKFLSSVVNGQLLGVSSSRRGGDLLELLELNGSRLVSKKKLESRMFVDMSDDFTYIYSQNGHNYMIDDQWRIWNTNFDFKLPYNIAKESSYSLESSEMLSKQFTENGILITYLGNPILENSFADVSTYEKKYAIVKGKNNEVGILKLNPSACLHLVTPSSPMIFYHNPCFNLDNSTDTKSSSYSDIEVDLQDINPDDLKFYINDNGYMLYAPFQQRSGKWILSLPYFQVNTTFGKVVSKDIDVAITYDGLDWMHKTVSMSSIHKEGFSISMSGNSCTDSKGAATIHFDIEAVGGHPQQPVIVEISGMGKISFSGDKKRVSIPVYVAEGETKTFTYNVTVHEEGCPMVKKSFIKKISHRKKESNNDDEIILY